jgi:hypothetical protein
MLLPSALTGSVPQCYATTATVPRTDSGLVAVYEPPGFVSLPLCAGTQANIVAVHPSTSRATVGH